MSAIRVRFPPSPTGYCHVGTARMALLNYLFARKHGGAIVFRIEDTDKARSTKEFEADIIESVTWIGLTWDEFYRQSERTEVYKTAIQKLIAENKAYISQEESKKNPGEVVNVVRLRNPGEIITFTDLVRGDITFDTTELGDFAIARAVDDPLYHLTVVVDDEEMRISHIIRGEEHISNTPRQILIQEALGYSRPQYAHYPLFLGADKSKLSKRKGDVAVKEYREAGFLPEALLNYIGTLGWTPPSGKEILSLTEMVSQFELADLHKSGAVFDIEKLRWYNRQYLSTLSESVFNEHVLSELEETLSSRQIPWNKPMAVRLVPLIKERISVWDDIKTLVAEGEYDFFFTEPELLPADIPGKGNTSEAASFHLSKLRELFSSDASRFENPELLKALVWEYATTAGRGAVLWPLRYVLSGRERSPDPFLIASLIGFDATLARIEAGIKALV